MFGFRMRPVATMEVTAEHVCPHTLDSDRYRRTITLMENARGARRLRNAASVVSDTADLAHWLAGGALPATARPIKETR